MSTRNVLMLVCLVAAMSLSACMRASSSQQLASVVAPGGTSVYLAANQTGHFVPLDPLTLADQTDVAPLEFNSSTLTLSADGQTLVTIERQTNGGEAVRSDRVTVVVRDAATMMERMRFHPPADVVMPMLSRDGSLLVLQRQPVGAADTSAWDVLSTADGKLLNSVTGGRSGLWPSWIDPDAHRLYRLMTNTPTHAGDRGPWPSVLEAYDLVSGPTVGRLDLGDVLGGVWDTGGRVQQAPIIRQMQPGASLSADGKRLAIVHADADELTLVDTEHLAVERSLRFTSARVPGAALWNLFDLHPQAALAKVLEGTERSATYSPDGRSLYVRGREQALDEHEKPRVHGRGLELIDVNSAQIVARGLDSMSIEQVRLTPDGSVLYALGYATPQSLEANAQSWMLWRLDASTLAIQAQRRLSDFHQLFVL